MLEVDTGLPILAVKTGRLLSASPSSIFLLLLHPRKVSVYSVSGKTGLSSHGSSFNMLLTYQHILQRSAYSVIVGAFGQQSRDLMAVLSLDGNLSFYEQESFSFSRFLPNFLLPSSIAYLHDSDSFIVASSSLTIESYRYQILAIMKDDDGGSKQLNVNPSQSGLHASSKGSRLTADWSTVIGEPVIDIQIVTNDKEKSSKKSTGIIVLGDRNIFILRPNGCIVLSFKMDFTPISFMSYFHDSQIMTLIATEHSSLLVYSYDCLKWAAQLPFLPIDVRRANVGGLDGLLVSLSDEGLLSVLYLGTNPSTNPISLNGYGMTDYITDYEEAEKELNMLKRTIKLFEDGNLGHPGKVGSVKAIQAQTFPITLDLNEKHSRQEDMEDSRSVSIEISISTSEAVKSVKVMVDPPDDLFEISKRTFDLVRLKPDVTEVLRLDVSVTENGQQFILPPLLELNVTVSCLMEGGRPRVQSLSHTLPLKVVAKLVSPQKSAASRGDVSLALDLVVKSSFSLQDILMSDFDNNVLQNEIGVDIRGSDIVFISLSTKSASQSKLIVNSFSFSSLAFVFLHVIRRIQAISGTKVISSSFPQSSIPLDYLFQAIDNHVQTRLEYSSKQELLSRFSTQFRSIEKRFLTMMKDRNPVSINDLDYLLQYVHGKIMRTTSELIRISNQGRENRNQLGTITSLICQMISIGADQEYPVVKAALANTVPNMDAMQGWEEVTVIALDRMLNKTTGIKTWDSPLALERESQEIKNKIKATVNLLYKGKVTISSLTLSSSTDHSPLSASPPPGINTKSVTFVSPSEQVILEEDEETES